MPTRALQHCCREKRHSSSAAISSPFLARLDHLLRSLLSVGDQPQPEHEVNEPGGGVELQAQLAGGVVKGEGVVVVVETLTWETERELQE